MYFDKESVWCEIRTQNMYANSMGLFHFLHVQNSLSEKMIARKKDLQRYKSLSLSVLNLCVCVKSLRKSMRRVKKIYFHKELGFFRIQI